MSEALPLPPRSRLERYKKLAKELAETSKLDDPVAMRQWATRWLESLATSMGMDADKPDVGQRIDGGAQWLGRRWQQILEKKGRAGRGILTDAQYLIAKAHGFESWPKFARHLQSLEGAEGSPFEMAADAIVNGNIDELRKLLRENPKLVVARSEREHRSTLLHYVSANGVEDFRQKTPPNIVSITRVLLEAGAGVDAESDAYPGRSTVLELAATSWHPHKEGVQIQLLKLLLEWGAAIDGVRGDSIVNACLANGRGEAAAFLASRGARLDLDGAAGAGALDTVRRFLAQKGDLGGGTQEQMLRGFIWACQFGRRDIAAYLLDHGVDVAGPLPDSGATGLHWAAHEGHAEIVKILLDHGAPVAVKDKRFDGTPLEWAIYGWAHLTPALSARGDHYATVARLVAAGARLDPSWFEDQPELLAKARADVRMAAALTK